jgi:hypothetical protein
MKDLGSLMLYCEQVKTLYLEMFNIMSCRLTARTFIHSEYFVAPAYQTTVSRPRAFNLIRTYYSCRLFNDAVSTAVTNV